MNPALIRNLRRSLQGLQLITDETSDDDALVIAARTLNFHQDLLRRALTTARERALPSGLHEPWHAGSMIHVWTFDHKAGRYVHAGIRQIKDRRETSRGWMIETHNYEVAQWLGGDYAWTNGRDDLFMTTHPQTEFDQLPSMNRREPKLKYYRFSTSRIEGHREASVIMTAASLNEIQRLFAHPHSLEIARGGWLEQLPAGSLDERGVPTAEHVYYQAGRWTEPYRIHPDEESILTRQRAMRRLGAK